MNLPEKSLLSTKACICTLNIRAWRTDRLHAGETAAVNAKHGTARAAKVGVDICASPLLKSIRELDTAARADHYRLTLPAGDKGLRLLPAARQIEHAELMGNYIAERQRLVAAFLAGYEQLKADAPARLNGLYVASQWPSKAEVADKFGFTVRVLPVPDVGQWADWMAEAAMAAQEDLTERFAEAVRNIAKRLADPKGRFWDSLTGNLAELIALAPDLNLRDDPQIAALIKGSSELLEHDADTLREDPIARADTATKASNLLAAFNL